MTMVPLQCHQNQKKKVFGKNTKNEAKTLVELIKPKHKSRFSTEVSDMRRKRKLLQKRLIRIKQFHFVHYMSHKHNHENDRPVTLAHILL